MNRFARSQRAGHSDEGDAEPRGADEGPASVIHGLRRALNVHAEVAVDGVATGAPWRDVAAR